MSSVLEFRELHPWKPYDMVILANGEEWECISYPWDENSNVLINVRKQGDPTTLCRIAVDDIRPDVKVKMDFDGYFEALVKRWIKRKPGGFKHHTVVVSAGPWAPDALSYKSEKRTLHFHFYAALRNGFGGFGPGEIEQIIDLI